MKSETNRTNGHGTNGGHGVNGHSQRTGRAVPRSVDLFSGEDFRCALLGSLGFSTRLIMSRTELTPAQISYRLRKGRIRRSDYRNG